MVQFYLLPDWFFGYDIALEFLFGVITAVVALFAFRVHGLCAQRDCKLLGYAFTSISVSYFLLALLNLFAGMSQIGNSVITIALRDITNPSSIWIYAYIIFFLLGLSLLAYLTFNLRNQRLFTLVASLSIIVVIFSTNTGIAFNFVAAVLLFYVALHYAERCRNSGGKGSLVMIAFVLLFFARLSFAFSYLNPFPYVLDHFLELIAYSLILISLVKMVRK